MEVRPQASAILAVESLTCLVGFADGLFDLAEADLSFSRAAWTASMPRPTASCVP